MCGHHKKLAAVSCAIMVALALTSCKKSSDSSSSSSTPTSTTISGVASKGPLNNATVCAFQIVSGAKGPAIGSCVMTDSSGHYTLPVGTPSTGVMLEITGGSYIDEATGTSTTLTTPLHTVLNSVSGTNVSAAVTPLTDMAYQMASSAAGGLTSANVQVAVTTVENNFGVTDIVSTQPVDALNLPSGAAASQKAYALALAMVSQYQSTLPSGTSLATALSTLQACLVTPTGAGCSAIGATLATAMSTFESTHSSLAGITLPVSNFGNVTGGGGGGGPSTGQLSFTASVGGVTSITGQTVQAAATTSTTTSSLTWGTVPGPQLIVNYTNVPGYYEALIVQLNSTTPTSVTALNTNYIYQCLLSGTYSGVPTCSGVGIGFSRSGGTISFQSTPMKTFYGSSGNFTISGSMAFTPF